MGDSQKEKNLELERLVFFSDAVVAIAITLLALDLHIEKAAAHLSFSDLLHAWKTFAAFFLSFLMVAVFWTIHHRFFFYIREIDSKAMFFNLGWLLFIVMLPFATTLISQDFSDVTASFVYSTVILAITCFQNTLWDYVTDKPGQVRENLTEEVKKEFRVACNIAMVNALVAIGLSFISPAFAFITLFTRTIMFRRSAIQYISSRRRKRLRK